MVDYVDPLLGRLGGKKTSKTGGDKLKSLQGLQGLIADNPNIDAMTIGKQLGLSETDVKALIGSGSSEGTDAFQRLGLAKPRDIKPSASNQKLRQDREESIRASVSAGKEGLQRADALNRVEDAEGFNQLGEGFTPAIARFLDRQGERLGLDLFAGDQKDIQRLEAAGVFDIGEITSLWKGAISDYENRLFAQTAGTTNKDPEFIRDKIVKTIYSGAATDIRAKMQDQLSNAFGTDLPVSNVYMSNTNVVKAMDFIAQNAGLPDLTKMEPGTREQEKAAREWANFARDGGSNPVIKAAILMANAQRGNANMGDPNVLRDLIKEGLIPDGTLGVSVNSNREPAPRVNDDFLKNLGINGEASSEPPSFDSEDAARQYLNDLGPDERPSVIIINGRRARIGNN